MKNAGSKPRPLRLYFNAPKGRRFIRENSGKINWNVRSIFGAIMNPQWRSLITVEPGKRGGRPCIRGMRITVFDVLSYLAAGMSSQQILDDFPYLTSADIQACLAFATERERSMLVEVA
jgi:uncharacterized protein (DUF433 family)